MIELVGITGETFGNLKVIGLSDKTYPSGTKLYECLCACGNTTFVQKADLINNSTSSCGCLRYNRGTRPSDIVPSRVVYAKGLYATYQRNAKIGSREFNLLFDEFIEICQRPCFHCHTVPTRSYKIQKNYIDLHGLDRLENTFGYTKINSVSSCSNCNFMKGEMGFIDFYKQCAKVALAQRMVRLI